MNRTAGRGPVRGLFRFRSLLPFALAVLALLPPHAGAAPLRVVLVSVDGLTVRPDDPRWPALAAIAARGRSTPAARTPANLPFPAWTELLTGCGPARTQVRDEAGRGLRAPVPTLAAALATLGVPSLALPADPLAHARCGLARGFAAWSASSPAMSDSARVDSALAWLARPGRRGVWLALSAGVPAEPWRRADGAGPLDAARTAALDGALARLDAGLARMGAADSTLLVVCGTVAAPGAEWRVPLAIAAGARTRLHGALPADAGLEDVAPTLVAAAGGRPAGFDGRDLFAPRSARRRAAAPAPVPDLMAAPPGCAAELAARIARGVPAGDSTALAGWDSLAARYPDDARVALERDVILSRAGAEDRAARGLKAAVAAHPDDPRPALAYAEHLLRHDHADVVPDVLQNVPEDAPFAALALWRLALARATTQDFVAAEGVARHAAALASPNADALATPELLHALGGLADSVAAAPRSAEARLRYGRALGEFGLFTAAYPQFHAARALLPKSAEPDYGMAVYLERQGRAAHATAALLRGLERDPHHLPSRLLAADCLLQLDRRKEARAQLELAQAERGVDGRALYNLACLRAGDADDAGALDALERAVAAGYAEWDQIASDPDLARVRTDPRFRRLLERRGR